MEMELSREVSGQLATARCPVCESAVTLQKFKIEGFGYQECRICDHLWMHPQPTEKQILDYYKPKDDGSYSTTAQTDFEAVRVKMFQNLYVTLEKDLHRSLHGMKILDVGCYTGFSMRALANLGADVYGVDLQEDAVAYAKKTFGERVTCADVTKDIPFPGVKFDLIVLSDVIEHVSDPRPLLRALRRSAHSDAIFYITTPNWSSWVAKLLGKYWPGISPVHHLHHYSLRSLELLLTEVGLRKHLQRPLYKTLSLAYVRWILPKLNKDLTFISRLIPKSWGNFSIPLYGGETRVIAYRDDRK